MNIYSKGFASDFMIIRVFNHCIAVVIMIDFIDFFLVSHLTVVDIKLHSYKH